jgi:hypothetical protein
MSFELAQAQYDAMEPPDFFDEEHEEVEVDEFDLADQQNKARKEEG